MLANLFDDCESGGWREGGFTGCVATLTPSTPACHPLPHQRTRYPTNASLPDDYAVHGQRPDFRGVFASGFLAAPSGLGFQESGDRPFFPDRCCGVLRGSGALGESRVASQTASRFSLSSCIVKTRDVWRYTHQRLTFRLILELVVRAASRHLVGRVWVPGGGFGTRWCELFVSPGNGSP